MPRLRRMVVSCIISCLLAGCGCPNTDLPEQKSTEKCVLERFIVSRDNSYILLPLVIKGKKYDFILDTGAGLTVYDESLRYLLDKPVQQNIMLTPHGDFLAALFLSPPARLGHFGLRAMSPVLCLDLAAFRDYCSKDVYGLLGMDFLRGQVLRIDFDRSEVTFLQSADNDSGVRFPLTFHNYIPEVQLTIPGLPQQESFQVDTGFASLGSGSIRADVFDALAKRGILKLAGQTTALTLSGPRNISKGFVENIGFGPFRHKKLLFTRTLNANYLGIEYWSRYVVTFDFPNKALYLKESRQFDRKEKEKGEKEKGDSVE